MTHHSPTIVIVGGVAAGASAATRARRMNEHARIILFEKDAHASFANCGLPYYIGGEIADRGKLIVAKPELFRDRFGIDVRTRHEVTAIDRARKAVRVKNHATGEEFDQPYDKLILAPGAAPIVPPIEGVGSVNVLTLRNLEDTDRVKGYIEQRKPRRAVVVGAGFIGLEMVEQLHRHGMSVALVELTPQVLPPLDVEMARLVQAELVKHGVELHLGDGIAGLVTEGELATHVTLNSGAKLPADLVILGVGVRPNTKIAEAAGIAIGPNRGVAVNAFGQTNDPDIYAAGDAAEGVHGVTGATFRAPLGGPANRAGRLVGEHAATGGSAEIPAVMGTAIVRVFDAVAGMTGLTMKAAARLNIESTSVIVEARHHAGYYPGAQPMVLKLVFNPTTGRVLGAQAVGGEGIDKRMDVIATAMKFGATVEDLTELDLAYAPPFGSAKDPVHMAGFAAGNARAGVVRFAQPDEDLTGVQVVDVRSPDEFATGRIPGAVNIPVDELRGRLGELDRSKPTVTVCRSGQRAYIAARILMQHGFTDVRDLTGSMLMREQARPGEVVR